MGWFKKRSTAGIEVGVWCLGVLGVGVIPLPSLSAQQPRLRAILRGHKVPVSVAFSGDGKILLSKDKDEFRLWDVASGKIKLTRKSEGGPVAINSDGELLVWGGKDGTVSLRDAATGAGKRTFKGHAANVYCVAFSPDDKLLASGSDDKTVKLWRIADGKNLATLKHESDVLAIAFNRNGKLLASGDWNGAVKLWEVETGKEKARLEGHSGMVHAVAFSSDGKCLASGGSDETVKIWDVAKGEEKPCPRPLEENGLVVSLAFGGQSRLLASGSFGFVGRKKVQPGEVKLWDVETRELRATLKGRTLAISNDGKQLASGSADGTVRLWDIPVK